jgi:hypothetical protein
LLPVAVAVVVVHGTQQEELLVMVVVVEQVLPHYSGKMELQVPR